MTPSRPAARRSASGKSAPAATAPVIQVFGLERDPATRAAIRFFKERRTAISFVDLRVRPIARGELRHFVERLGAPGLLDPASRAYRDAGLAYLRMEDESIVERVLADPSLLRLPFVRRGSAVSVGRDESTWSAMLTSGGGS